MCALGQAHTLHALCSQVRVCCRRATRRVSICNWSVELQFSVLLFFVFMSHRVLTMSASCLFIMHCPSILSSFLL